MTIANATEPGSSIGTVVRYLVEGETNFVTPYQFPMAEVLEAFDITVIYEGKLYSPEAPGQITVLTNSVSEDTEGDGDHVIITEGDYILFDGSGKQVSVMSPNQYVIGFSLCPIVERIKFNVGRGHREFTFTS